MMNMPPGITPVYEILTKRELNVLRAAYAQEPAVLAEFAATTYDGLFPPGSTIFDAITSRFYTHGAPPEKPLSPLPQRDREVVLIALLSLRRGSTVPLAIHLYWGMMVGLEPEEVGEVLLLAGVYGGIDSYTLGLGAMTSTLTTLKNLVATNRTTPLQVVRALSSPDLESGPASLNPADVANRLGKMAP
jgi:alkylhydroperoxidase/carboxymuconolactone decarboxylase family protein YurZ